MKQAPRRKKSSTGIQAKIDQKNLVIVVLLVSFVVYFNVLFNGFVWDDQIAISADKLQRDVTNFSALSDFWVRSASNYYRPMIGVTYTLLYSIFGLQPWGFHLLNLLFHAGVSVLAFFVVSRLLKDHGPSNIDPDFPAFWAALFFAVHPLHSESVAWVSGITDPSYSFFYLLSFLLYLQSTSDGELIKKGIFSISLISFLIAMLYKEPAVTLPAVLIAYDFLFRKASVSRLFGFLKRQVPYLIVTGVYLLLRFHALSGFATGPVRHSELSAPKHFINVFPFFMEYLYKLLLPVHLSSFYALHPISSVFEMKGIIALIVLAAFIGLSLVAMKKNRAFFFGLILIVVPLLPALYIRATGPGSFAERYLYLSVLGLAILLALFFHWAETTMSSKSMFVTIGFAALIGLCSAMTIYRNAIWKNDFTLWTDAVAKAPDGALPHHNLGNELLTAGRTDEAIEQYKIVLALSPDDYDAHNNLGATYVKKGLLQEAIQEFETAVKLRPDIAATHGNLGNAYRVSGAVDKAVEECGLAVKLAPNDAYAHNDLGLALAKKGLLDQALGHLREAARLHPDDPALAGDLDKVIEFKKGRR